MCVSVLLTGMHVYHMCAWCPQRREEGIRPGTGLTDGYEQLCGCSESNLDSLGAASALNQ